MAIDKSIMWLVLIIVGVMMSMVVLVSAAAPPPPAKAPFDEVCYAVYMNLALCRDYEVNGTAPSADCCYGTRNIYEYQASYPVERQDVCSCLKTIANNTALPPPMLTRFTALPGKCDVKFPYEISPNMDCSRV